ncbi:YecR family lipoprotein [Candidatus Liberibacter solanacearum]|uniref:YecR family lipoprotein n=1 Tax=Candidatus Liberibacter solanacearum TaxID=556287 RepID=UPI000681FA36|nr:YecR family lipoprotein [Candidatus Liberibacter solanacearum]
MSYSSRSILTIIVIICLLQGCFYPPRIHSLGGSKADGIVTFGYQSDIFTAKLIPEQLEVTKQSAIKRCQLWGYKNAEPFTGLTSQCENRNQDGYCIESSTKINFQCYDK